MCNQADQDKIEAIVEGFMLGDTSFTAFDATKEARKQGITERHGVIKRIVHRFMDNEDANDYPNTSVYEKTLIKTPTGNAYLYHPENETAPSRWGFPEDEVDDGDDASVDPDPVQVPAAKSASALLKQQDPNISLIQKQLVDSEARLPVYKNLLSELNANWGDVIYVSTNGILSKKASDGAVAYGVNADGRIRISQSVLQDIFGNGYNGTFELHVVKDEIRIYAL
jgi:hypothetical protein